MGNTPGKLSAASPSGGQPTPPPRPDSAGYRRELSAQTRVRDGVTFVTNASAAFLAGSAVKFVETSRQTGWILSKTKACAIGEAATAPATGALVAVALVDTVADKVFAETKGKETWTGTAKRSGPGLATAVALTFATGATLPEALAAWAVYKVVKNSWFSITQFAEGRTASLIDYKPAVAQAKAAWEHARASVSKCCTRASAPVKPDATAPKSA